MSVSIYCSPTHLKLISGSVKNNSIKIDDFHDIPLPEGAMINGIVTNEAEMSAFLAQIKENTGIADQDTTLVIANNSVMSKLMDVPAVNETMMLEFIKQDLSSSPEESEQNVFDYAVLNTGGANGALILAVSVSKSLIQSYMNVFVNAGFKLMNIDIGVNALIKAAATLPELNNGTCILATVDDKALAVTLFQEGVYSITNKYRLVNAEYSDDWYNEMGSNISSFMQFHKGQRGEDEISSAYFAGLSDEQLGILSSAISYLGLPIYGINYDSFVSLEGNAAAAASDFNPGKFLFNLGALLGR